MAELGVAEFILKEIRGARNVKQPTALNFAEVRLRFKAEACLRNLELVTLGDLSHIPGQDGI